MKLEKPKKEFRVEDQVAQKEETAKNLRYMCDRDRQKVKGIFHFYECEGATLDFVYRAYKWDDIERYSFVDGEIYEIPLGVAKHLNKNGWYPEHVYKLDANGKPEQRIGQKRRRYGFQSLEFIDPEEIGQARASEIITVQNI